MKSIVVAIDGPAGSGKSTIAKILAKKYDMTYLDTGAMYRMVAYYFLINKVDVTSKLDVQKSLENLSIDIEGNKFFLNKIDVSQEIRTPEITGLVSRTAAIKEVRDKLVVLQREISNGKNAILDGRDIGTVVFPNADVKIYLVASPEERAKRRVQDYRDKGIDGEEFQEVLKAIKERDYLDSSREESPLKKAEDAIEIDSSFMNIEEVCNIISGYIEKIKG